MTSSTTTADFPVVWENPADAKKCWRYDAEHTPGAVSPAGFELGVGPFVEGFGWGMKPIQMNYYAFYEFGPPPGSAGPPPKPSAESLRRDAARWEAEILPEVLGHIEFYRNTDFDAMPDEQLASEIERLRDLRFRQGELHTAVVSPGWTGVQFLIDAYKELTHGDELSALRLVQGHGNKSVEAGEQLWRVSKVAASIPRVRARLMDVDKPSAGKCLRELEADPDAASFVEAFRRYLETYGWRSGGEFAAPTWAEDPETPILLLRSLLEQEDYDPVAEQERLARQREEAIANTMGQLDDAGKARLREALEIASSTVSFAEDHNFHIDQRMYLLPRRLVLAVGRRLVAKGALNRADDVFYLRTAELTGALRGSVEGTGALAAKRGEDLDYWRNVRPPTYIGTAPPGEQRHTSPLHESAAGEPEAELRGTPASSGVFRGVARIVLTLEESDRLHPGEILVTRVTQPAWTPLFGVAGGVVTEVGGVLSHTAIAAREFGIPAIAAVARATKRLKDGQLIEVDGSAGVIRVIG